MQDDNHEPATNSDMAASQPGYHVDLSNCAREPIHIPGHIQPHGVLLVLSTPELTVAQASGNTDILLGIRPEELLGQNVSRIVAAEQRAAFLRQLQEADSNYANPLQASIQAGAHRMVFDGLVHRQRGLLVLELENPRPASLAAPAHPVELGRLFRLTRQALSRVHTATGLQRLCEILAHEVRSFSGFDRVMLYQFEEDGHGHVIAEDMAAEQESYLGLHYPASDIPQQARRLYALNWLRLIPDASYQAAPLIPAINPVTCRPLDMSHSMLRSVSPVHIQYLKNMGVAASMSISVLNGTELWGLIACHHRTPKFIPSDVRAACELLGTVMSLQLSTKAEGEDFARRGEVQTIHNRLMQSLAGARSWSAGLAQSAADLLALVRAQGAAVVADGECFLVGQTPAEPQVLALAAWLRDYVAQDVVHTECLSAMYPPAGAFAHVASGLLAVTVQASPGNCVLWFRPEVIQTINWAGNPDKPVQVSPNDPAMLSPRQSFAAWQQTVHRTSEPWKPYELDAGLALRHGLLFISNIRRAEELRQQSEDLRQSNRELSSFAYAAAHDLKEPLRGIHGYADALQETCGATADVEVQHRLQGIMRLTKRMNNLLDSLLHVSQVSHAEVATEELVDLNEVLSEALDMVGARREESRTDVRVPRPLPHVCCNHVWVREVFTNLISNAIKFNDKPKRWIEIGYQESPAEGGPVLYVRDNGIGLKQRYFERIFRIFSRLHERDAYGGGTGAGLAIVKKIIERHGGDIWVESTLGEGSTFYFTLRSGPRGARRANACEAPVGDDHR